MKFLLPSRFRVPALLAVAAFAIQTVSPAASTTMAKPEDVGISSERLHRINDLVQRYMDANDITGAVTVVTRRGKVAHFEAQGLMDVEAKTPMRKDAIFRMASMSKPVTGVAILMLVEEGRIRLTDPVSRFIPDFKDVQVAVAKPLPPGAGRGSAGGPQPIDIYMVPPTREITIRDLDRSAPLEWDLV